MITATKRFEFCYGHYLPEYDGLCATQHGHNSILEITVSGPPIDEISPKGMVCDFKRLKEIVATHIIDKIDHRNLNDLPMRPSGFGAPEWTPHVLTMYDIMRDMPTAENMVAWVRAILYNIFGKNIQVIRLYETPTSYVEWRK